MADHIVTQIRDAAASALADLTTSGARVYPSRVHRWGGGNVPGLALYTNEWRTVDQTGVRGARKFGREVDLVIVAAAAVESDADLDDTLDRMVKEVEAAMATDVTLGGKAKDSFPVAIRTEMGGDGESRIGKAQIDYLVIARTAEGAPDVAVN